MSSANATQYPPSMQSL
ncbi:hypothetical protein AYI70_g8672, partial [Smittium culicis]